MPDGTAVRVSRVANAWLDIAVRPPAGSFREPISVGRSVEDADAAVAIGRWAAFVLLDARSGLRLTVVRPDGTSTERKLDGTQATAPAVGIDALGNVTAAWLTPAGLQTTNGLVAPQADTVDVAVSPAAGGCSPGAPRRRCSRAWTTTRSSARGSFLPSRMTAEIADDGAALFAFQDGATGAVTVVDRAAGGDRPHHAPCLLYIRWSRPSSETTSTISRRCSTATDEPWPHGSTPGPSLGIFGLGGRPGAVGPTHAPFLPDPRRGRPAVGFDASGDPLVLVAESEIGARADVGAARRRTRCPLDAQLTLPARRLFDPHRRAGITAIVRCAKPCDVPSAPTARSPPTPVAARRADHPAAAALHRHPGAVPTRPLEKVELAVADRAGRVQASSARIACGSSSARCARSGRPVTALRHREPRR